MRYYLTGELQYSYSHDVSKTEPIKACFDADDLEKAIIISRAMLQNRKIMNEEASNQVEKMDAVLTGERGMVLWKSQLKLEETRTKVEVVTPEHFEETFL